jgi:hypothetical protein
MSRINNVTELRAEIVRLRKVSEEQKQQIKNNVQDIGESLKPSNLLFSFLSSVTGIHIDKNEFFKDGIAYGISLLIQRFVLKTEKKIEHKIYEWVDTLFIRIKDFMNRHTDSSSRREERHEETAGNK